MGNAEHLKQWRWPKGVSGNPNGRPKGSISPRDKIRQVFEENEELFEDWLIEYISDPRNRKHVVELLDGKPHQSVDLTTAGKELPQPILNVFPYISNAEGNADEQENPGGTGGNISQ